MFKNLQLCGKDSIQLRPKTDYIHLSACLALLDGKPITVGSNLSVNRDANSVEQLNGTSWISLKEFPASICHHSCIGMDDHILVFGGAVSESDNIWRDSKIVYMFQNSNWIIVGNLSQKVENQSHFVKQK